MSVCAIGGCTTPPGNHRLTVNIGKDALVEGATGPVLADLGVCDEHHEWIVLHPTWRPSSVSR